MSLTSNDLSVLSFILQKPSNSSHETVFNDKASQTDAERMEKELAAIQLAEIKNIDQALEQIKLVCSQFPNHPSPQNNQAQILRLLHKNEQAMEVLDSLIVRFSPAHFPTVLRQAHAQRAWLRLLKDELADARADFQRSFELGNLDAGKMIKRCDPYAAMCNSMLAEVMQKLYSK